MILLSWVVYSGVVVIHRGFDVASIVLGLVLFIAMYGIVALQNDLSDIETDTINRRHDIPYSMGLLTENQLIKTMFILSIVATIVGFLLNQLVLLWVGLYIFLGYSYSGPFNVKSRGIFAALLLGFCYGAMPWLIAASVTGQLGTFDLMSVTIASFVFSSGIIVLKDFKDIKGDKATHKRTLLVAKGPDYTRRYYLLITSLAYVLLIVHSHVAVNNSLLTVVGIVFGLVNYWLLAKKSILTEATSRSLRGKWARGIFFGYALTLYFIFVVY